MRYIGLVTLLAVASFLSACATTRKQLYPGDVRPAGETALLRSISSLQVMEMDGRTVDESSVHFTPSSIEYEILPGTHSLVVRYSVMYDLDESDHAPFRSDPVTLTFLAEAGHTYDLRFRTSNERVVGMVDVDMDVEIWVEEAGASTVQAPARDTVVSTVVPDPKPGFRDMNSMDDLKEAWENASEEERERFLRSIVSGR
jgi:hypothetical protein